MQDPALALRLEKFQIDHGNPALSFAARLARENRWPLTFAHRVVSEYFRFIYLAAISPRPVTPSNEIDQAWHLHLCYTRSYWHDLCRDLLKRELHHGPTKGGRAENEKFTDWYAYTLDLYQREFGQPEPSEIWPPSAERFAPQAIPVTVTPQRYWLIEKRPVKRSLITTAIASIPLASVGALASSRASSNEGFKYFLIFAAIAGVVLLLVYAFRRAGSGTSKNERTNGCSSSCGTIHSCGTSSNSDSSSSGCSSGSSGCGGGCGGGGD